MPEADLGLRGNSGISEGITAPGSSGELHLRVNCCLAGSHLFSCEAQSLSRRLLVTHSFSIFRWLIWRTCGDSNVQAWKTLNTQWKAESETHRSPA